MNNEFFHFEENKNSDKLIVIFSGVKSKSFMGYKLIEDFDCNKIFGQPHNAMYFLHILNTLKTYIYATVFNQNHTIDSFSNFYVNFNKYKYLEKAKLFY